MVKALLACCTILVTTTAVGCAEPPAEEEEMSETTSHISSDEICTIAAVASGAAVGAAVSLSYTTGACGVAMAVTVAGEAACLAPAAGAAASWVAALGAGAVMWLTCRSATGAATTSEVHASESAQTGTGTKTRTCNEADLADGCDCDELDRRYSLQKTLCAEGGRCDFSMDCSAVERVMKVARNCINARRDVQRCYRVPDFDGHQTQINNQCQRFQNCNSVAVSCADYATFPQLPSPCAF
ncbi:MAG: hypothetical protein KIT84_00030 [Labilithrix sp.]|nr:hypothetical protein [Labilithrix sp.]MCW5809369.1 hypothetical protein [Labilithrix sp.]